MDLVKTNVIRRLVHISKPNNSSQEIIIYGKDATSTDKIDYFIFNDLQVNHSVETCIRKIMLL